jgi:hypothetical protein
MVRQHAMFLLDEKIRFSAKGQTGDKTFFLLRVPTKFQISDMKPTDRATTISDRYIWRNRYVETADSDIDTRSLRDGPAVMGTRVSTFTPGIARFRRAHLETCSDRWMSSPNSYIE